MQLKNDVVKKTKYDELDKNITDIKTIDTSDLVKKLTPIQKLMKFVKKITDHDDSNKYITTQEFYKLTTDNFAARLKKQIQQAKMILLILQQQQKNPILMKTKKLQ